MNAGVSPMLIVISGTQGAGKSTVARLLAAQFDRGACVSADTLQHLIVAGGRWPEGRYPSDEARAQLRLRLKHTCLLGISFVRAGFTAVLDDIIVGSRLDDLFLDLAGQRFVFVMLTPRADVVRARETGRGTRQWQQWHWLEEEIRCRTRRVGLWLDNSDQTPAQTTTAILERGWTDGLVEAPAMQTRDP